MAEWYYSNGGQRFGPVQLEEIQNLVASGDLGPADLVWRNGMADWTAGNLIPELREMFPAQATANPIFAQQPAPLSYARPSDGPPLTHRGLQMLRATQPWVRFVSVMMFVGIGLGAIAIAVMIATIIAASSRYGSGGGLAAIPGLLSIGILCLYIAPAIYLSRYASRIASLSRSMHWKDLEAALESQKSFWKFTGILLLILTCFYAVIFLLAFLRAF